MNSLSSILRFSAVCTLLATAVHAQEALVPERLQGERETYFFSTESLRVLDGRVSGPGLPDHLRSTLDSYLKLPKTSGCVRLIPLEKESDHLVPRSSIAEAARKSDGVLRGRVIGLSSGFRSTGEGGTLVQVEAEAVLKGAWLRERSTYYVFLPVGQYDFGGVHFCAVGSDWVSIPNVGDSLLLFIPYAGWSDQAFLEIYDAAGMIVLKSGGLADLPVRYRSNVAFGAPSADDILRQVVEATRDSGVSK